MSRNTEIRTTIILLIGIIVAVAAAFLNPVFDIILPEKDFLIHVILEIISISVAIAIAIQLWMVFPHTLSKHRLILGALFLTVGLFDFFHVLAYKEMPYSGGMSSQDEHWFWLISRLTLAIGSVILFSQSDSQMKKNSRTYIFLIVAIYVAVVAFVIFNSSNNLPILIDANGQTTLKILLEFLIISTFVGTIAILFNLYRKTKNESHLVLIVAFSFTLLCELVLTLNINSSFPQSVIGHLFKISSYYFCMKGIYAAAIEEPFSKQKEAQIALQESEIKLEAFVKKINYLAYHDELTGLPNRNYLLNCLEENIKKMGSSGDKFALVSINLNRFKNVNDTLGNEMGDLFLRTAAERLKEFKTNNVVVSRMVADEFILFIPNKENIEELIRLAYLIHKRIEEPMIAKGFKFHITSSIGITLFSENIEDTSQIIKQVQLAMHEAKKNGQSVMVYHPDMNKELFDNLLLENDLRQALNRNELILHYQPQVNIETGEIIGVEALIRWNHHKKGMISPGKFIPLAEETGLIIPIGNWVIEEACKQLKSWLDKGLTPFRLSVNLSLRQLFQEDLVETVTKALQKSKIKPEFLELEVTESMAGNTDRVITILQSLKKLGVRISVDDFGTGYSSLSYLYSFPIDQLKIDRSFIMNLFTEENNKVIVSTIISMGQNLGLELIAEGVETIEQIEFLRANRCVGVQGFLISRPLPAVELENLLSEKTILLDRCTS
ncbi:MAG TPA: EAL domain-containing protein [Bacillus bacterium]|nr:EAL domain-containing protein [Bacillus sp. (in: firmicutes)]